MTSLSSDKKIFASVKRKLEYNSPLKDKMILHLLQRGPSLDVHLPAPRLVVVENEAQKANPEMDLMEIDH